MPETLLNSTDEQSKEIPKTVLGLEAKYQEENSKTVRAENITENLVDSLPTPSGWRILVLPFTPKDKTKGGIIFSQESLDKLRIGTNCGYVLKMGPLAYNDKERYPTGPWCKQGDFILVRPNAGTRLVIHDREFRLINDDSVEAVVQDPRGIKRKFI